LVDTRISRWPVVDNAVSRVSVRGELEKRLELAGAENFSDCRIHVTKNDPATVRSNNPVQGHKVTERRRARKLNSAKVDYKVGTPGLTHMRFVVIPQLQNRGWVEPQAIPELRNQDPTDIMSLNRGLEHQSPVRSR
jgi:hypothetical protein